MAAWLSETGPAARRLEWAGCLVTGGVQVELPDRDPDVALSRVAELGMLLRAGGGSVCCDALGAGVSPELVAVLRKLGASLAIRGRAGAVHRAPVTYAQRAFVTGPQPGEPQVYNIALRITFGGPLNTAALGDALSALVARHETLRTRFVMAGDDWWQEVLPPRPAGLVVQDITALPPPAREAEIERVSARLAGTRFDLLAGTEPVFGLLRVTGSRWVLLFVMHHVSCDGWGVGVLLNDLGALYTAAVSGLPHGLEPAWQPSEYALWELSKPAADDRKLAFWLRHLAGAPSGNGLPTDRPRPAGLSGRGDVVHFSVPAAERARLEAYARRHRATPFAVTAAAFGVLLTRLSGQPDIVVGVLYANRERRAHENLAACIAMNFCLRIRVAQAQSFGDLVAAVFRDTAGAMANMMPRRQIAARAGQVQLPGPLTVAFQYENPLETETGFGGLTAGIEDLPVAAARAELCVGLTPAGDGLSGYAEYSTDLWDSTTIEQWAHAYRELLRDLIQDQVSTGRPATGAGPAEAGRPSQAPATGR